MISERTIMRPRGLVTLFSLALVTPGAAPGATVQSRDEAVAAIQQLEAARAHAYAQSDASALPALLTDDIDFVTSNAYWFRGRKETEEALLQVIFPMMRMQRRASGQATTGQPRLEAIRFMTPDVAVLHLAGSSKNRLLQVVARENGTWRFAAYHSTQPAAAEGFALPASRGVDDDDAPSVSTWPLRDRPAAVSEEDEAIRSLVEASAEAFRQKDASAYAALFVDDADFVTANALWWHGREQIEKGTQAVLSGPLPSTLVTEKVENVRLLASNVALVHTWVEAENYSVPAARPALPAVVGGRTTRIVAEEDGQWRVVAYQGTNASLLPPPLRGRLPGIQRPSKKNP